ncbi:MAG TPA: lysylphosphatidylglycerol synthase transmembrane domain-containing protein [Candidatus Acidoferrales bacterium]|nr:lysylphosphatidylglycerol synthase transmembrane domain-containing protein [Candidatus Acidoferrales bacterium]
MRPALKKILLLIAGVVVIAALLYHTRRSAMLAGFSWQKFSAELKDANFALLALSLATIFVSYAIRALRWQRFARYMGRARFKNIYSATIIGFTSIFLLGRAGEPVRPLLIARKDRLSVAGNFGVYVLERIFDAAATVVMAAVALVMIAPGSLNTSERGINMLRDARLAGWALFGGLLVVVALLIYFRLRGAHTLGARLGVWRKRGGWRGRLATLTAGFGEGLQAIRSFGDLLVAIFYTALHWLVMAFVYLWIIESFRVGGRPFEFRGALLVLAFTMVGSVVQLPAVGGGMQLSTFLVLSVIFGMASEPAAAIAITIWIISFAAVSVVGVPLLVHEGWSMGALRDLAREEEADEERGKHVSLRGVDAAKRSTETKP